MEVMSALLMQCRSTSLPTKPVAPVTMTFILFCLEVELVWHSAAILRMIVIVIGQLFESDSHPPLALF